MRELLDAGERLAHHRAGLSAVEEELRQLVPQAVAAGVPIAEVARLAGVSRVTVYKILKEAK